ncbi:transporter family-2 protein [Paraburkholderia sp. BL6669N2]|uniref:DMT family transporter n=1 Tax=Paraburkholderia sp. BL6669N2 TaxID=1938807 RepID=UPI000E251F3A|nr:DMT family transporter [Paraburkholderia sp. BL6669N2]REG51039.1 transporter family-2 protein [Paraburkholderia sp. BL6669N2]
MNLIFLLIAFCAGSAISIQAAVNSQLAGGIGGNVVAAALVSFSIGTVALAAIAVSKGGLHAAVVSLPSQPLWRFGGGLLGAAAIFCTVLLVPRIGLANMLALVIAGQLLSSLAIDQFGLIGAVTRQVSGIKLAGALVMLTGVCLTLFGNSLVQALTKHS